MKEFCALFEANQRVRKQKTSFDNIILLPLHIPGQTVFVHQKDKKFLLALHLKPTVVPQGRRRFYSVELIYLWVSEMCNGTRAFRSVYSSTTKLDHTASYNRCYVCGRMSKLDGWHQMNRRVGNDAVGRFINLIYLDSTEVAGQIFTCPKCEIDMEPSEYKQLGLDPSLNRNAKRIRSVFIDAKLIGLLKDDDGGVDKHDVLTGTPGLKVRMLPKRPVHNAMTIIIKTVRNCIFKVRNSASVPVRHAGKDYTDVG